MKLIKILVVVALMMGDLHLHAQEFGVDYTAELQTNFSDFNFINLLRLNAELPLQKSVSLDVSTISIAKTRDERLVDDLQTFSNIEEDNLPLALALCGVNWMFTPQSQGNRGESSHSFFLGIRNMNEDYFTGEVTSFFTNSSCGVYPTISCNYDIANYPLASVGVHYKYMRLIGDDNSGESADSSDAVIVQASIYNGAGHNRFFGCDNVFRFCPKDDGIFALAQMECRRKDSRYFFGNAFCSGKDFGFMPWLYAEQRLNKRMNLLAGYSHAYGSNIECRDFVGLGLHIKQSRSELGLFSDYVHFANANEFATEINCKIQLSQHLFIQPVAHLIYTRRSAHDLPNSFTPVALLRFGIYCCPVKKGQ